MSRPMKIGIAFKLFCAILGLQRWNGAVAPRAEAA